MEIKIFSKTITDNRICIFLNDRSICELDRHWSIPDTFWFTRLKVIQVRQGRGNFLMKELCKILDRRKINVLNGINAYGDMSYDNLKKFYLKYGFKENKDGGLHRAYAK